MELLKLNSHRYFYSDFFLAITAQNSFPETKMDCNQIFQLVNTEQMCIAFRFYLCDFENYKSQWGIFCFYLHLTSNEQHTVFPYTSFVFRFCEWGKITNITWEWKVLMHISLQSDKQDLISNRAHGHFHVNTFFYI